MMNQQIHASDFYVAGGTLRPNAPSYTVRPADDELFNLTLAGEFCYVLTSRQMGKSSLMIRTARRLQAKGVHSVIIDLTKLGIEVSVDQWYLGLLTQLKRRLKLEVNPDAWWQSHAHLGYAQRFTDFLHDVLLEQIQGQVVIFMDEIDTTLNLAFSDDFFAAIRYVYNARATDPAYQRLTFVLLGVATPAELIKDRSRTPFNIGQGIDLGDFSRQDAQVLEQGLDALYPGQARAIFDRIFHWTNGHPYLTQKLCLSVTETGPANERWTNEQIDALVEQLFLSKEARKETNLQFVRDYVSNSPQKRRLLKLYRQVYTGKVVPEDERSIDQNQLKLFGLVRVENDILKVRNQIYRRVFNLDWVKATTPVDWTARITAILALTVFLLIALFGYSYWQSQRAIADQAKNYIDTFWSTTSPDVRITSMAGLFNLPGYENEAKKLFFKELTPEERLALFQADPQAVGSQLITVVRGLYTDLENTDSGNQLLQVMVQPLAQVDDLRAGNITTEIEQWLTGRDFFARGDYQQAVTVYTLVIDLMNDQNPGIYFDRGMAYTKLNRPEQALSDFETALTLDPNRQSRIQQVVEGTPLLYKTVTNKGQTYPAVARIIATPTSTPTPTNTPTPTPTPTNTSTPTPTFTPTPTRQNSTPTPLPAARQTPTGVPTPAPTPTITPTPLPTPTNTPQPAEVIFVQSNGQTHALGLVTSAGQVKNATLHRLAAAPTWSPNGKQVAFYGEPGINELGGVYTQGSGIWTLDIQSGQVTQIFKIDHVTNMNWAPDGNKLAFEIAPPGVKRQVVVIDVRDGRELHRFPGEQPAWSPNGQELVIKACQPECGLWKVGFDGQGGELLTGDGTDSYPTWSPTGQYIAFASRSRTGDWEIYRLDPATGDLLRLTNRPGTDTTPVFSPDGLEIYYRTDATGSWDIRAMAVDASTERTVISNIGPSDDWGQARAAVH